MDWVWHNILNEAIILNSDNTLLGKMLRNLTCYRNHLNKIRVEAIQYFKKNKYFIHLTASTTWENFVRETCAFWFN